MTGKQARVMAGFLLALGFGQAAGAQQLAGFRVFPNPVHVSRGENGVTFDQITGADVRIFTIDGALIREFNGVSSFVWDLTNDSGDKVESGVYIYLVTMGGEKITGKIAVIR